MTWEEKLKFIFDTQKYKCVTVYDCKNNIICDYKDIESNTLHNNLNTLLSDWEKQVFKCNLRTANTVANEKAHIHYFNTKEAPAGEKVEQQPIAIQGVSNESIQVQIAQGVKDALAKNEYEIKLKAVQEQENFLKTTGGQIGILMQNIAPNFGQNFLTPTAPIQGTTMQEVKLPIEIKDDEIRTALVTILSAVSKEELLFIAEKLKTNPDLVQKLKMFM